MLSRRQFIAVSLIAAGGFGVLVRVAGAAPRRQFPAVPLKSTLLRDGIWAVFERGGNSMLIASDNGPILVDTKLANATSLLAEEVRKVAGSVPTMIINTHHHYDHTGGNFAFDDAAEIVAHKNLNPRMQKNLDEMVKPALATEINSLRASGHDDQAAQMAAWADRLTVDDFKADREFEQSLDLERGSLKLTLRHFGNGHTDNDTVVHVTSANVIHMGDLFFHKCHPFIDIAAGADTLNWRTTIRKVIDQCDDQTVVIPGHGEVTDRTGLKTQIDYLDQLQAVVERAMREGKSRQSVTELQPAEFANLGLETLRPVALGAMYDELASRMN